MSEAVINGFARELAAKAYNRRAAEYPDEISSDMEQENVKKSLEDLLIFIQQCTKAGKKVVLCIEFGIRRYENFRFHQITSLLIKREFQEYDPNAIHIILGIDADFTNSSMLRTLDELLDASLPEGYKLVNKELLEEDSRRFQVTPLPGEETDVSKGNANLYFFQVEEDLILDDRLYNNEAIFNLLDIVTKRERNSSTRKLNFYTYFVKHYIDTSYFKECDMAVTYYKAQQSETIRQFSRNSVPRLPFWKMLRSLCHSSFSKIYYANIAHFETNSVGYIGGEVKKGCGINQLRENKYSEKMSEIWHILLNIAETPVFLLDLDIGTNKTFETQGPSRIFVVLTEGLAFKKQDETPRIKISRQQFDSFDQFMSTSPSSIRFDSGTPEVIESIDWDSLCADPPDAAEGGRRKKRKSKKQSNKTKSHDKKRGTRKGK